jgi:hypothetical protein
VRHEARVTEPNIERSDDYVSTTESTPLFLLSTARSGSTLLQRILGTYPEIATTSEPWLLIPLVYALRRRGVYAEYEHGTMVSAIEDFCSELPGGREDLQREIADLARRLYARQTKPGQRYFLDKTPPYFLVVDEILEWFPDAKFVFLWRNPLAVAASLADWPQRDWGGLYRENLFFGLANLIDASRRHGERVCSIRFEDYVTGDRETWQRLMDYLEMPFRSESLTEFVDVGLPGRMGDKSGTALYGSLSSEPLEKWRTTLANPLRKEAARRYLSWIGRERLSIMGYDGDRLYAELDEIPAGTQNLVPDACNLARAMLTEPIHVAARRRVNVGRPSSLRYILGSGRAL